MFTLDQAPASIDPRSILLWTEEQFRKIETALQKLGKREPYTPIWTASGTQPVLGDGVLQGSYVELGSFIVVSVYLLAGATTTFGTGQWTFSLPRIPVQVTPRWTGSAVQFDQSAGLNYAGTARLSSALNNGNLVVSNYGVADTQNTIPFAWANTDQFWVTIGYPVE